LVSEQNEDDLFSFSKTAMSNTSYIIHAANGYISGSDSIAYNIQVIPDLFPAISVEEERDSTSLLSMFFTGEVKDDYGFKRLSFNYQVQNGDNSEAWKAVDIPVSRDQSMDNFFLKELHLFIGMVGWWSWKKQQATERTISWTLTSS
jgi:hypothetical protein